jgi:surface-anchored protein
LWSTGSFGAANVKMQTNDGVNSLFDREVIPAGTHAHYNWGFTQPGTYELGITVSSTHPTFGLQSGTETITVHVVPEPGSAMLLGLGLAAFALRRQRRLLPE